MGYSKVRNRLAKNRPRSQNVNLLVFPNAVNLLDSEMGSVCTLTLPQMTHFRRSGYPLALTDRVLIRSGRGSASASLGDNQG